MPKLTPQNVRFRQNASFHWQFYFFNIPFIIEVILSPILYPIIGHYCILPCLHTDLSLKVSHIVTMDYSLQETQHWEQNRNLFK